VSELTLCGEAGGEERTNMHSDREESTEVTSGTGTRADIKEKVPYSRNGSGEGKKIENRPQNSIELAMVLSRDA